MTYTWKQKLAWWVFCATLAIMFAVYVGVSSGFEFFGPPKTAEQTQTDNVVHDLCVIYPDQPGC
jgi:uncharacterized membrane protein